jgi:AcrR family transcriptional regulator
MKAKPTTAQALLKAARKLFEKHGADAVTMRRVGDAVGVSAMAIYRHYPNRQALLDRIAGEAFTDLAAHIAAKANEVDPLARLTQLADLHLDFALAHRRIYDYMFLAPRPGARRYPDDFVSRASPTANLTADAVADAMRQGLLRDDDVWAVTLALSTQTHGLISLYLGERFAYTAPEFRAFYHATLGRLIDGLKNR